MEETDRFQSRQGWWELEVIGQRTYKHICIAHEHRQWCGNGWSGGWDGWRGQIVSRIKKISKNILRWGLKAYLLCIWNSNFLRSCVLSGNPKLKCIEFRARSLAPLPKVLKVWSQNQHHQRHMEMARNSSSRAPHRPSESEIVSRTPRAFPNKTIFIHNSHNVPKVLLLSARPTPSPNGPALPPCLPCL